MTINYYLVKTKKNTNKKSEKKKEDNLKNFKLKKFESILFMLTKSFIIFFFLVFHLFPLKGLRNADCRTEVLTGKILNQNQK